MNLDQIKQDLGEIRNVEDITIWHYPAVTDGHLDVGSVSSISVDIIPADSTQMLNDVMNEHELVIKEANAGTEGMNVKLQKEGRVHE